MNAINIIILIILLLLVFGVIIGIILIARKKDSGKTGTVPPTPSYCQQFPDDPRCGPQTIHCGILDPNTIQKCDDDPYKCQQCQCTSDPTVQANCMSCQTITADNTYAFNISQNLCSDPFYWDSEKNGCYLKPGQYCLPVDVKDITCNQFTGNKVLSRPDPSGPYEWRCICKDPTAFTNYPDFKGDCIGINLCGMAGQPNPKDINTPGRKLVKFGDTGTLWDGTFDPISQGQCSCNPNEFSPNNPCPNPGENCKENLVCEVSGCLSGVSSDGKTCNSCPVGYIDCYTVAWRTDPQYSFLGPYYTGICSYPGCVPDPCDPGDGSTGFFYDINSNSCVCPPGYNSVTSPGANYPKCVNLCKNNGPCAERGICFVPDKSDYVYWKFEWNTQPIDNNQDKYYYSLQFSKDKDPNDGKYLDWDGNKFFLNDTTVTYFQLLPGTNTEDDDGNLIQNPKGFNSIPNQYPGQNTVSYPFNGSSYQFQVAKRDQTGAFNYLGYLNFSSLKIDINQTFAKDSTNNPYTFVYQSLTTTKGTPIGAFLFQDTSQREKGNFFVGLDSSTPPVLTILANFNNVAKCKCCISPYTQNPENMFCATLLKYTGQDCNQNCDCAGGYCQKESIGSNYCMSAGKFGGGVKGEISSSQFYDPLSQTRPDLFCNQYIQSLYQPDIDCGLTPNR
jgi:hypothetical protein